MTRWSGSLAPCEFSRKRLKISPCGLFVWRRRSKLLLQVELQKPHHGVKSTTKIERERPSFDSGLLSPYPRIFDHFPHSRHIGLDRSGELLWRARYHLDSRA